MSALNLCLISCGHCTQLNRHLKKYTNESLGNSPILMRELCCYIQPSKKLWLCFASNYIYAQSPIAQIHKKILLAHDID